MPKPDRRRDISVIAGLLALHARLQAEMATVDDQFGLSRSERSVILSLEEARRLGWLSRELGLSPPALTALADSLEAKGLVGRAPDPADRRATVLVLSAQGRELLGALLAASSRIVNASTRLSDAELDTLAALLDRMRLEPPLA